MRALVTLQFLLVALVVHERLPSRSDVWPVLMQSSSCTTAMEVDTSRATFYVARVVAVDSVRQAPFVKWLQRYRLPIWRELKREGRLASQSVFQVTRARSAQPDVPSWHYLILTRIGEGTTPTEYLRVEAQRETAARSRSGIDSVPAIVRRIEILRSTPNSFYPTPSVSSAARSATPMYLIEYIAVRDSAPLLSEYRESMRRNSGPTLGELVKAGMVINFIALETVAVCQTEAATAAWNQIHVMGLPPGQSQALRRGVFDSVLKSLNPASGGYRRVYARLDSIRVHTRIDEARELVELQVQ